MIIHNRFLIEDYVADFIKEIQTTMFMIEQKVIYELKIITPEVFNYKIMFDKVELIFEFHLSDNVDEVCKFRFVIIDDEKGEGTPPVDIKDAMYYLRKNVFSHIGE